MSTPPRGPFATPKGEIFTAKMDDLVSDSSFAGKMHGEAQAEFVAQVRKEAVEGIQYVGKRMVLEADPYGKTPSDAGAKLDAGKIRPSLIFNAMPRALQAVAEVGTYGANKYSPDGWLEVPNGVERYTDAMDRHRLKEGVEGLHDVDSGLLHAAQIAWNALARLELMLRQTES